MGEVFSAAATEEEVEACEEDNWSYYHITKITGDVEASTDACFGLVDAFVSGTLDKDTFEFKGLDGADYSIMDENAQKYFGAALRLFEEGKPEDTFEEYKDKMELSEVKPEFAQG